MTVERASAPGALGTRLPILLNPEAGSKPAERADDVREMLSLSGIEPVIELVKPEALAARLRELAQGGAPAVAVGGGDGTISSAANALIGTETVLVPLPLGTLNHFATRYGLATLEAARLAFTTGSIIRIPVGSANGHAFVNNASCGFYPRVVRQRERLRPLLSKWPAAALASLLMLARRPLLELELELDGNRIERKTAALWIGLGRHSLRLPQPGDAEKAGEMLELVLPKPHSRLQLVLLALRVWNRLRKSQKPIDQGLETLRTTHFRLRSSRSIEVATDGEVRVLKSPVEFRYHPRAVRLLCMVAPDGE